MESRSGGISGGIAQGQASRRNVREGVDLRVAPVTATLSAHAPRTTGGEGADTDNQAPTDTQEPPLVASPAATTHDVSRPSAAAAIDSSSGTNVNLNAAKAGGPERGVSSAAAASHGAAAGVRDSEAPPRAHVTPRPQVETQMVEVPPPLTTETRSVESSTLSVPTPGPAGDAPLPGATATQAGSASSGPGRSPDISPMPSFSSGGGGSGTPLSGVHSSSLSPRAFGDSMSAGGVGYSRHRDGREGGHGSPAAHGRATASVNMSALRLHGRGHGHALDDSLDDSSDNGGGAHSRTGSGQQLVHRTGARRPPVGPARIGRTITGDSGDGGGSAIASASALPRPGSGRARSQSRGSEGSGQAEPGDDAGGRQVTRMHSTGGSTRASRGSEGEIPASLRQALPPQMNFLTKQGTFYRTATRDGLLIGSPRRRDGMRPAVRARFDRILRINHLYAKAVAFKRDRTVDFMVRFDHNLYGWGFLTLVVVASVGGFLLQTMPSLRDGEGLDIQASDWAIAELVFAVVFSAELLLRFAGYVRAGPERDAERDAAAARAEADAKKAAKEAKTLGRELTERRGRRGLGRGDRRGRDSITEWGMASRRTRLGGGGHESVMGVNGSPRANKSGTPPGQGVEARDATPVAAAIGTSPGMQRGEATDSAALRRGGHGGGWVQCSGICGPVRRLKHRNQWVRYTLESSGFWTHPLVWVDLLALAPFYIGLMACSGDPLDVECAQQRRHNASLGLQVLECTKIFRVLKLTRHFSGSAVIVNVIRRVGPILFGPLTFLGVSVLFYAVILFVVDESQVDVLLEQNNCSATDDATRDTIRSPFTDVLNAGYFVVVTLTTTGFGDQVPASSEARGITGLLMLFGVLFTAIFTAVTGQEFFRQHVEHEAAERAKNTPPVTLARRRTVLPPLLQSNKDEMLVSLHQRYTELGATLQALVKLTARAKQRSTHALAAESGTWTGAVGTSMQSSALAMDAEADTDAHIVVETRRLLGIAYGNKVLFDAGFDVSLRTRRLGKVKAPTPASAASSRKARNPKLAAIATDAEFGGSGMPSPVREQHDPVNDSGGTRTSGPDSNEDAKDAPASGSAPAAQQSETTGSSTAPTMSPLAEAGLSGAASMHESRPPLLDGDSEVGSSRGAHSVSTASGEAASRGAVLTTPAPTRLPAPMLAKVVAPILAAGASPGAGGSTPSKAQTKSASSMPRLDLRLNWSHARRLLRQFVRRHVHFVTELGNFQTNASTSALGTSVRGAGPNAQSIYVKHLSTGEYIAGSKDISAQLSRLRDGVGRRRLHRVPFVDVRHTLFDVLESTSHHTDAMSDEQLAARTLIARVYNGVVLASVMLWMAESMQSLRTSSSDADGNTLNDSVWGVSPRQTWVVVASTVLSLVFSVVLACRLASFDVYNPGETIPWHSPYTKLDAVALLPWLVLSCLNLSGVSLGVTEAVHSITSVVVMLRVFRVAQTVRGIEVLRTALGRAAPILLIPTFMLIVFSLGLATLLYLVESQALPDGYVHDVCDPEGDLAGLYAPERDRHGQDVSLVGSHRVTDAFSGLWVVLQAVTSVGFGDMVAQTVVGRLVTLVAMLFGLFYLAMPISIVGQSFHRAWERFSESQDTYTLRLPRSYAAMWDKYQRASVRLADMLVRLDWDVDDQESADKEGGPALSRLGSTDGSVGGSVGAHSLTSSVQPQPLGIRVPQAAAPAVVAAGPGLGAASPLTDGTGSRNRADSVDRLVAGTGGASTPTVSEVASHHLNRSGGGDAAGSGRTHLSIGTIGSGQGSTHIRVSPRGAVVGGFAAAAAADDVSASGEAATSAVATGGGGGRRTSAPMYNRGESTVSAAGTEVGTVHSVDTQMLNTNVDEARHSVTGGKRAARSSRAKRMRSRHSTESGTNRSQAELMAALAIELDASLQHLTDTHRRMSRCVDCVSQIVRGFTPANEDFVQDKMLMVTRRQLEATRKRLMQSGRGALPVGVSAAGVDDNADATGTLVKSRSGRSRQFFAATDLHGGTVGSNAHSPCCGIRSCACGGAWTVLCPRRCWCRVSGPLGAVGSAIQWMLDVACCRRPCRARRRGTRAQRDGGDGHGHGGDGSTGARPRAQFTLRGPSRRVAPVVAAVKWRRGVDELAEASPTVSAPLDGATPSFTASAAGTTGMSAVAGSGDSGTDSDDEMEELRAAVVSQSKYIRMRDAAVVGGDEDEDEDEGKGDAGGAATSSASSKVGGAAIHNGGLPPGATDVHVPGGDGSRLLALVMDSSAEERPPDLADDGSGYGGAAETKGSRSDSDARSGDAPPPALPVALRPSLR